MTDPFCELIQGDMMEVLAAMPEGSIHLCVTSPPYFGLRKYEGAQERIWIAPDMQAREADDPCEHVWGQRTEQFHKGQVPDQKWKANSSVAEAGQITAGATCALCGSWRGAYGLEPDVDCGRPFLKLRDDLAVIEREYVMQELKRLGVIDAEQYDDT